MSRPGTVDEYVAALPPDAAAVVAELRRTIRDAVPGVEEAISYSMPTCVLHGSPLVHVAAWKKHIGRCPLPELSGPLAEDLAPYRGVKDAMRLPLAEPISYSWSAGWSPPWPTARGVGGDQGR